MRRGQYVVRFVERIKNNVLKSISVGKDIFSIVLNVPYKA